MDTLKSIAKILNGSICDSPETFNAYTQRMKEGAPTRDENPKSHFCVYFLPYNSKNRNVLIVHHKKSGLWLSPGGHIDKNESLLEALNREIGEELGVKEFFEDEPLPFLLTITQIENVVHPCKTHYDVWYLIPTDGSNFNLDPAEFHDTKWLDIKQAKKIVGDQPNRTALEIIDK